MVQIKISISPNTDLIRLFCCVDEFMITQQWNYISHSLENIRPHTDKSRSSLKNGLDIYRIDCLKMLVVHPVTKDCLAICMIEMREEWHPV